MTYIIVRNVNNIDENKLITFYKNIHKIKRDKIKKIKIKNKQKLSIYGEYLLMKALKKYYGIKYEDLDFYYNENGKAYIKNYNIYFNVSHSYDMVAIVLSNKECGIDIEKIRNFDISSLKIFTNNIEERYILEDNSFNRLFEIYTLKESYLKMKGLSLSSINDVNFIIRNKKVICSDSTVKCILKYYDNYIVSVSIKL